MCVFVALPYDVVLDGTDSYSDFDSENNLN